MTIKIDSKVVSNNVVLLSMLVNNNLSFLKIVVIIIMYDNVDHGSKINNNICYYV